MNRRDRRAVRSQERSQGASGTPAQQLFVAALQLHRADQLREAAELYRQVLALDPNHLESLQNLGAIASNAGHYDLAIELFRRAIALNDQVTDIHCNIAAAHHALGQWSQAVVHGRRAASLKPDNVAAYMVTGAALEQQNQLAEALVCFTQAVVLDPLNSTAHIQRANLARMQGHTAEAEASFERAISLDPDRSPAHFYLGNLRMQQGRFQEAVDCYLRAIAIKPDHLDAHSNFCSALRAQSKYVEAIAHYKQVLAYKPDFIEGHIDLSSALLACGEPQRALESVRRSLRLGETEEGKKIFAICVRGLTLAVSDGEMPKLLTRALSDPWDRPGSMMGYCCKQIKADAAVADALSRVTAAWPERLSDASLFGVAGIGAFARNRLLCAMLESAMVTDIPLERFLTNARQCLLRAAAVMSTDDAVDEDILGFYTCLARQCFITEYVYAVTNEERAEIDRLQSALCDASRAGRRFPQLWLVALAAYVPLYALAECQTWIAQQWSDAIDALLTQQVREPMVELQLRSTIPSLTVIDDEVSKLVRDQYEQNPYPRWVKAPILTASQGFDMHLRQILPRAKFRSPANSEALNMLTAGCGTGQQLFDMAQALRGLQALAVDLSYASLSYAKRQVMAGGLNNIEFGQADIMRLGALDRTFDIIECGGVLHHLRDPEAGWRELLLLLRPNGLMRVALYSECARRQIVAAQQVVAQGGYGRSADEIRRFRQEFLDHPDQDLVAQIVELGDFFGVSQCRDLLFHVQEHRFTVPRIKTFLSANDLQFIGFEVFPAVSRRYAERFPEDAALNDLDRWHVFEQEHPRTFLGMYQFWVQKSAADAPPPALA